MNGIDTTGHQPGCPEPVGGDCDCAAAAFQQQIDIAAEGGERLAAAMDAVEASRSLAQVWCDKCDQPATREIALTNGSTAFRCSTHAWALVAPKGR